MTTPTVDMSDVDAPVTELDVLDPTPEIITLKNGIKVRIEEMRGRQILRLIKIVTRPFNQGLINLNQLEFDADAEPTVFAFRLAGVIASIAPEAEDEVFAFIRSMCTPGDLIEKRVLQKADAVANKAKWDALDKELINPSYQDMFAIIKAIMLREAEDLQSLGKEVKETLKIALATGIIPKSIAPIFQGWISSEESPEPSTDSNQPTDTPTNTAWTSPSEDYVKSLP